MPTRQFVVVAPFSEIVPLKTVELAFTVVVVPLSEILASVIADVPENFA
jgi:hypothetical protein